MIRNAVLHPAGEQPMLADLLVRPRPSDVTLLCTNLRTIDGKRPRTIDHQDALFIIPLATIRFIEVSADQLAAATAGLDQADPVGSEPAPHNGRAKGGRNGYQAEPLPPADDALVPIPGQELYSVLPGPDQPIELDAGDLATADSEPDEDLLRRIRDV